MNKINEAPMDQIAKNTLAAMQGSNIKQDQERTEKALMNPEVSKDAIILCSVNFQEGLLQELTTVEDISKLSNANYDAQAVLVNIDSDKGIADIHLPIGKYSGAAREYAIDTQFPSFEHWSDYCEFVDGQGNKIDFSKETPNTSAKTLYEVKKGIAEQLGDNMWTVIDPITARFGPATDMSDLSKTAK
jgi:hypothetical protein